MNKLLALLCFLSLLPSAKAGSLFRDAPAYPANSFPYSLALGDFNEDRKLDVVVAGWLGYSTGLSVILGNGDGSFQPPVFYDSATNPQAVIVGDFNGDKHLDLAAANTWGNPSVSILLGKGDGTFGAGVTYSVGHFPVSLAAADFNLDGKLDLVVTNAKDGTASVLLGKGDGSFQSAVSYQVGSEPYSVTVGDFNQDGAPDFAVSNYVGNNVAVFIGLGDGSFHLSQDVNTGNGPVSLAAGDFNGDSKLDLVVTNATDATVTLLLGQGDATFKTGATVDMKTPTKPRSIIVGDFNQDGKLDYTVEDFRTGLIIVFGNGDGTFKAPVRYVAGSGALSVAAGDVNGDHKLDLISSNTQGGTISILLAEGGGKFQAADTFKTGNASIGVAAADFNLDGEADLAVANQGSNDISILLGKGDGTFRSTPNLPGGTGPSAIVAADFNHDSKPDLAITELAPIQGHTLDILLGNGDGTFQRMIQYPTGRFPFSLAVGDLNGDGNLDLVVTTSGAIWFLEVFLGNGDGTFRLVAKYSDGLYAGGVAVGDFNQDGKADLAVTVSAFKGGVAILLGKGDGTFRAPVNYTLQDKSSYPVIATADLNRDGKLDLVVPVAENQGYYAMVAVLLGNGDGTFQEPASLYTTGPGGAAALVVADFNLDGFIDVINTNPGFGTVSVLLGNGDGSLMPAVDYDAGFGPFALAVSDFNHDGAPDLAFTQYGGTVSTLLNTAGK